MTLEEMKDYLRVDYGDDDALIEGMIRAAVRQCMDILRTDSEDDLAAAQNGKIAVSSRRPISMSTGRKPTTTPYTLRFGRSCSEAGRRDSDGYRSFEPEGHRTEKYSCSG